MKMLTQENLNKINEITKEIRKHLCLQGVLSKEKTEMAISVRIAHNTIFVNNINKHVAANDQDDNWKKEFHEITRDYISLLATHANTMILRKQDELLKIVKPEVGLATIPLYKVILKEVDTRYVRTVQIIKKNTNLGLIESKHLAVNLPCLIKQNLKESEAVNLAKEFIDHGSYAFVIPQTSNPPW